ncbi:hypothetical protein [Neisseria bacilliformis]|uniref:hypothetical protein n=1 Tax=Neisseria bacilliformis TaxID=267212 RepID=UPI0028E7B28C|nr:hypothetical protein [Neisseria bacilliformis]
MPDIAQFADGYQSGINARPTDSRRSGQQVAWVETQHSCKPPMLVLQPKLPAAARAKHQRGRLKKRFSDGL